MSGPWEDYQQQAKPENTAMPWLDYQGQEQVDHKPVQEYAGFLDEMGQNFTNAIQSGKDLLSGDYSTPWGNHPITPKTQALADKLFPQGYNGSISDAASNALNNTHLSDYSGSLLENFSANPAGKALGVLGGTVYNLPSTVVNRYVNPTIEKYTGINPDNLQVLELIGGATKGGVDIYKGNSASFSDPTLSTIKTAKDVVNNIKAAGSNALGGATVNASDVLNNGYTPVAKPAPLTSSNVKDLASRSYAAADALGGGLAPDAYNKFIDSASKVAPQTEAGKAFSGNNPITQTIADLQLTKDKPITLKAMQEIDEDLSNRIDQQTDPIKGVNKIGYKLQDIQQKFRDTFLNAPDSNLVGGADGIKAWREGQQLWATQMRMGDVERILNKADSADVPSTAIKNGLKNYVDKAANRRGWTDEEWVQLQKGAKTGIATGALKTLGSKLISGVAGAAGGAAGGIPGALLGAGIGEAIGYPMRLGATALQKSAPLAALDSLSSRAVINQAGEVPQSTALQPVATPISPSYQGVRPTGLLSAGSRMVQTPPVTLPNASSPSSMAVPTMPIPQQSSKFPSMPQNSTDAPIFGGLQRNTIGTNSGNDTLDQQSSVQDTIHNAAQKTGVDPNLLHGIATVESNLNPDAKAKTSTASGLMQITKPTWQALVMKHGKQYGFGMGDVMNPEANALAGAILTKENTQKLATKLGRDPDNGEIYMAHFLGPNKAVKLINAAPREVAAKLLPAEAYANKDVFYYKDGKPRDANEVKMLLSNKVNKAISKRQDQQDQAQQKAQADAAQRQKNAVLQSMASKIPQESIQALRGNPQLAGDFNKMYGDGASSLFLNS